MGKKFKGKFLNIQLFAEPNGQEDNGNETSLDELKAEIEKLKQENAKTKSANDKLASENADYKKKAKEKLSEEEKTKVAQEEKDKQLLEAQKELQTIKLTKEFMSCGFDETTITTIVDKFNEGNAIEFAKELSKHINTLVENKVKEAKEQTKANGILPSAIGGKQNGMNAQVERYLKAKDNKSNSARDYYFGNK